MDDFAFIDSIDDSPRVSKNPNGQAITSAEQTVTDGCRVSMVTGEALLMLTEGELPGVLPFAWKRVYRSSAVDLDCGVGFGWSHALAHRLAVVGDSLVWTDHENRSSTFALPSIARPAIRNSLAEAAICLGASPDELIVTQAARRYHFRDTLLTSISDAYDNRLHISRDATGHIQRLSNQAGQALLLRYEQAHIVAVDYQTFDAQSPLSDAWITRQTLVSYRYDAHQRLVEATNAAGQSERYRYDAQQVMLQRSSAAGASFFWAWQRVGKAARCVRHWASGSQMDTHYAWDDRGGVTLLRADGRRQVYVHDPRARLVQRIDAHGAQYFMSYDKQGRLTVEQDPLGAVTAYQYDQAGRLIWLFPGEDEPISYEYANGFLHLVRRGHAVWIFQRNKQGDITRKTDPDGNVTVYRYDTRGLLTEVRYPDGHLTRLDLADGE